MTTIKTKKIRIGKQEIIFETGKIGRQANGSVVVTSGETVLFNTACAIFNESTESDFLPLRVDYQEKFSAAGKTSSGYIKREGRPSAREILMSRLIDRPLRPLFEDGFYNEVQLLSYVWSFDDRYIPDPLAICGCSAALVISDIPFIKPIGAVKVGYIQDQFVVNPSRSELEESRLDLMLAGTEDAILMIEGYSDFINEEEMLKSIEFGHQAIREICKGLSEWQQEIGKKKIRTTLRPLSNEIIDAVAQIANPSLEEALKTGDKQKREEALSAIHHEVKSKLLPEGEKSKYLTTDVEMAIKKVSSKKMRSMILDQNLRSDGRKTEEIRTITIDQAILPRVHGSSLFTRGETQSLAVCTLGGENMAQRYEDLTGDGSHRFYMQYFFPPFSVGEVGRIGPPGRREIGHGMLAERALFASVPKKDEFPYTIRLESNITESNGSSSMASVCGGCLALMDAGVPIKRPVSGIAMGLILEGSRYVILSDILGIEDALGDMDFKVTGDEHGITAFQMDIKIEGITIDIMRDALRQAKDGRVHILKLMLEACPTHKEELSVYAPRIETIKISPSKIATVIGPGGKQIRAIIEETGAELDINDDGFVSISSSNVKGIERAKEIIYSLTSEPEIGKIYAGKVTSVVPFGIFVEILPGKEGLCHISEFDVGRTQDLNHYVKTGDNISVKLLDINERGQLVLSRKATLRLESHHQG